MKLTKRCLKQIIRENLSGFDKKSRNKKSFDEMRNLLKNTEIIQELYAQNIKDNIDMEKMLNAGYEKGIINKDDFDSSVESMISDVKPYHDKDLSEFIDDATENEFENTGTLFITLPFELIISDKNLPQEQINLGKQKILNLNPKETHNKIMTSFKGKKPINLAPVYFWDEGAKFAGGDETPSTIKYQPPHGFGDFCRIYGFAIKAGLM